MKNTLSLVIVCLGLVNADEIVTLSNGTKAILKDDKTWELVKPDTTKKIASLDTARFNQLVQFTYDKFKDYKTFSDKYPYSSKDAKFSMFVLCGKPGCTDRFNITTSSDEWQYLDDHDLDGLCDGEKIAFETPSHDGTVGDGYVLEFMWTTLPKGQLSKLGNCKELDLRLGITEFTIPYEKRESWRLLGQVFDK
jgi:hypothetical protein